MRAQWSDARSQVPSYISGHISQHCGVLDKYIVYQTGEYEYQGLVIKAVGQNQLFTYTRTSNYNQWDVQIGQTLDETYYVSHDLYTCSNLGYGTTVVPPSWALTETLSMAVIACAISIRWLVFPWFERRCRR